jgi:hypothetical protein
MTVTCGMLTDVDVAERREISQQSSHKASRLAHRSNSSRSTTLPGRDLSGGAGGLLKNGRRTASGPDHGDHRDADRGRHGCGMRNQPALCKRPRGARAQLDDVDMLDAAMANTVSDAGERASKRRTARGLDDCDDDLRDAGGRCRCGTKLSVPLHEIDRRAHSSKASRSKKLQRPRAQWGERVQQMTSALLVGRMTVTMTCGMLVLDVAAGRKLSVPLKRSP